MTAKKFKRGKIKHREERSLFVIAVEGKTEYEYFNTFRNKLASVRIFVDQGKSSNPRAVLQAVNGKLDALKRDGELRPGDEAWVIVDEDRWPEPELVEIWKWGAERRDRGIGFSVPQFEWWLLLHFEDGHGARTQREIMDRLNSYLPEYQKGNRKQLKFADEAISLAIERAYSKVKTVPYESGERQAVLGAWTSVHILVDKIQAAIKRSNP
ncbi:hypothetical protein CCANI_10075 [Corynebacterium canis]|uniref:RloB family protein n=1 Tax=Corynebacterium canis TaxID=679663 RepID=UPI0016453D69|nr:RloB family protein [Corynebacterium canis]WJY75842.1 hypothetical protein CCANI_10075 [Corynebacterium canis]